MELEKIRNLSEEELKSQQAKSAEQLFRLRFQKSLGNNEGTKKLRGLKLDIARIKTVARERELAAAKGAAPALRHRQCPVRAEDGGVEEGPDHEEGPGPHPHHPAREGTEPYGPGSEEVIWPEPKPARD